MAARAGGGVHRRSRKFLEAVAIELIEYATAVFSSRPGAPLPECPVCLAYVWAWFCELSAARTSNGFGLNPIGFAEIAAWARVTRADPTPWETALIRRLDSVVLPILNKVRGDKTSVSAKDVQGVSALFVGLRARANEVFK